MDEMTGVGVVVWMVYTVVVVAVSALWLRMAFPSASRRCAAVIAELLATERSFIASLVVFDTVYSPVLTAAAAIDPKPLGAVSLVRELHQTFLAKLEAAGPTREGVARTVSAMAPFFRLHVQYCCGAYTEIVCAITAKLAADPTFRETIEALRREDPRLAGLDPFAFAIMPVQRLPRIVLLLQQIRDCTPEKHSQRRNILGALSRMKEVTGALNEAQRTLENTTILSQLQEQTSNLPSVLLLPHRKVVRFGKLRLIGGGGGGGHFSSIVAQDVSLLLTNDVFVVVAEKVATKVAKAASRAAKAARISHLPRVSGAKGLKCRAMASNSEIVAVVKLAKDARLGLLSRIAGVAAKDSRQRRSRFEIHWRTNTEPEPFWLRFAAIDDQERDEWVANIDVARKTR
jgi:hypothetical protein